MRFPGGRRGRGLGLEKWHACVSRGWSTEKGGEEKERFTRVESQGIFFRGTVQIHLVDYLLEV